MIMKKSCIGKLAVMVAVIMFIISCTSADKPASTAEGPVKILDPGSSWVVSEDTTLSGLTIAGGTIGVPEGYSLTMTVDGVETAIKPGEYKGDIKLTLTEIILKEDPSHGSEFNLRAAVYLENGRYVPEKSVSAALVEGTVTATSVNDARITSVGEVFNGIIATGDSRAAYTISNPVIDLTGNGADDFAGVGAAIMVDGNADVTLNNAFITTNGCARTAIFVGGASTMEVNDSTIEVGSPSLPEGYKDVFTEGGKFFFRVPFMLGLSGTCRATNIVDKVKEVSYNNSHIKAQGWGAMSIDGGDNTVLTMTNCIIETVESGYGAYAIGGSTDIFKGCTVNVADMALVGTGGNGVFTDGTVVNSRRFGVMYHGSGDLTIDKGSVFNTKSTAIQLKSPSHNIVIDNAQINPENGIIIQVMPNDDPHNPVSIYGDGATLGADAPGARGASGPEGEAPEGGAIGARGGELPAGGEGGGIAPRPEGPEGTAVPEVAGNDINATFRNVTLKGDIINGDTASCPVNVSFEKATITGAITTAKVINAVGPDGEKITMTTPHLYMLIGEVKNIFGATNEKNGIEVSFDSDSRWVVDKTSYLTGLSIAGDNSITAPDGYSVSMTVDGVETQIRAGAYNGNIVLMVNKI